MDYITVTAKNLDDAITEALVQLEVTSDRLDYEGRYQSPQKRRACSRSKS